MSSQLAIRDVIATVTMRGIRKEHINTGAYRNNDVRPGLYLFISSARFVDA